MEIQLKDPKDSQNNIYYQLSQELPTQPTLTDSSDLSVTKTQVNDYLNIVFNPNLQKTSTIQEALDLAQAIREVLRDYFLKGELIPYRNTEGQSFTVVESPGTGKDDYLYKIRNEICDLIDSQLLEQISLKYTDMQNVTAMIEKRADEDFAREFNTKKVAEAEYNSRVKQHLDLDEIINLNINELQSTFSIKTYLRDYLEELQLVFTQRYVYDPICEVFKAVIVPPKFLISQLQIHFKEYIDKKVNTFMEHFELPLEHKWNEFVSRQLNEQSEVDLALLESLFAIVVTLPVKQDIKHEINLLSQLVSDVANQLGVKLQKKPQWLNSIIDLKPALLQLNNLLLIDGIGMATQRMHTLLFQVLKEFIQRQDYCGQVRHLLKLLLEVLKPVIYYITQSLDQTIYLTVLEQQLKQRVPKDKYDLKNMAQLLLNQKENLVLAGIQIEKSVQRTQVLDLVRVSDPFKQSGHVVICISGFLQEDADKTKEWAQVQTWYKHAEVYALSWTSCCMRDFYGGGVFSKDEQNSQTGFKQILNALNVFETGARQFIFAQDQARISGEILAAFLLKSNFSEEKAVTLIGFSLGSVVCMNCLRVLKKLYRLGNVKAARVVHDVQLWAGAYVIDPQKTYDERMRAAFHCSIINGRLINLWSVKDLVLSKIFTKIHPGQLPVGSQKILEDISDDIDGLQGIKKAENIDVQKEAGGHMQYMPQCLDFFPLIKSAY